MRWISIAAVCASMLLCASAQAACLRLASNGIGGASGDSTEAGGIGGTGYDVSVGAGGVRVEHDGAGGGDDGSADGDGIGGTGYAILDPLDAGELDEVRAGGFVPDLGPGEPIGLYGTLSSLDGACLNGLHLDVPPDARVERDGEPLSPSSLHVGQVVAVRARARGGLVVASRVILLPILEGSITEGGGGLRVLGAELSLVKGARVEDRDWAGVIGAEELRTGERVRVHGHWASGGGVVASLVERDRSIERDRVRGVLGAGEGGRPPHVGSVPIQPIASPGVAPGSWLAVSGVWDDDAGLMRADRFEREPAIVTPEDAWLSIEVLVRARPDGRHAFSALGLRFETTRFTTSLVDDLSVDTRLWLRGRVDAAGRVEVIEVRIAPEHPLEPSDGWILDSIERFERGDQSEHGILLQPFNWSGSWSRVGRDGPVLR